MESKLTKLVAPLERDEQSLMKLDAIFAVRIFLSFGLFLRHLKLRSEDLRFAGELTIVLCFLVCQCHKQKLTHQLFSGSTSPLILKISLRSTLNNWIFFYCLINIPKTYIDFLHSILPCAHLFLLTVLYSDF